MSVAVVRGGEKWSDPKCTLKVKSTGFAGGLEVRREKEVRVMPLSFILNNEAEAAGE